MNREEIPCFRKLFPYAVLFFINTRTWCHASSRRFHRTIDPVILHSADFSVP